MRVQGFAGSCRDVVNSGIDWLGQGRRRRRNRSRIAVYTDAESSRSSGRRTASAIHERSRTSDGLDKARTEQGHQHLIHAVQASVHSAVTAAYDGFSISDHLAKDAVAILRSPGKCDTRAEGAVEGQVGIFLAGTGVANEGETDLGVIHLAGQSSRLALPEVGLNIDLLPALIDQLHLLALGFCRRHFEGPTQAVGQRDRRLYAPAIAPVDVVVRDAAFVERWGERWVQRQVRARACVGDLCCRNDSQYCSVVAIPSRGADAGGSRGNASDVGSAV